MRAGSTPKTPPGPIITRKDRAMNDAEYANEIWKAIPIAPDYEVSDWGRVRRSTPDSGNRRMRILSAFRGAGGYEYVNLFVCHRSRQCSIHYCVLLAFVGERPTPLHQGAHFDGCRRNNRLQNLRWATAKENALDKQRHGTTVRGSGHVFAKVDEADVVIIRDLFDRHGLSTHELSSLYGLSLKAMYGIAYRKTWKHVC